MCKKVKFNIIEKNKFENPNDITKYITNAINELIIREFELSIKN